MPVATGLPVNAARNLSVLLAGALLCEFLWSWFNFSGPFRTLVDRELLWFGAYAEAPTAIALGLATVAVAGLCVVVLERLLPRPPAAAVELFVAAVFVALSCAMLLQSRKLWREADGLPDMHGPVQVVDLRALGDADPSTGHVRLLGVPASERAVTLRFHNRSASRLDVYVPMSAVLPGQDTGPVRLLGTTGARGSSAEPPPIPANPEGLLLRDAIDTRTIYELRQRGLRVVDRPWVLFWPGLDVGEDTRVEAVLLGAPVLLFWPFALVDWWRRRRTPGQPAASVPVAPPLDPAGAPRYFGYADPAEAWSWRRDTSLAGAGFGVSVFVLIALWEAGDVLPAFLETLGYKATGVLLLVSLAVDLLPSRRAARKAAAPAKAQPTVQERALRHLAAVLGVPASSLAQRPWPRSELVDRQFEVMERELLEVADAQLRRELEDGTLLRSLPMYCAQMERCMATDPGRVERVLSRRMPA